MPALKDRKHEAFCQAIHSGLSQAKAYVKAGYPAHRSNASKLARREHIVARLAELAEKQEEKVAQATEQAVEKLSVTVETLIKEADAIRTGAIAAAQFAAANSALISKAKLAGLWVEKSRTENNNVVAVISDEPMTQDEWVKQHVTPD